MPKQTTETPVLTAGDRVRAGTREGVVTLGAIPVNPFFPGFTTKDLCRVRWDGNTFSNVTDVRKLVKVDAEARE